MATENANIPKFPFPRPESSYDPPAELKNLRDAGPVHRIQLFDGTNAWIVTKNKEVCEMLTSEKFSNERYTRQGYPEIHSGGKKGGEKPTFVHMDDPEHSKQKDMVESFFTLAAVEPLRPEIERAVDLLLDSIKERGCKDGPIDLVQDFSSLVNPKVIFALFGASMMDTDQLAGSSAALGGTSGTAGELGHTDLHEYLSSLIDDRIQYADRPERDLISKLVIEQYKTGAMGKDDINRLVYMLFVAGNTAINSSISLGILSLLQHPKQLNAIRENPRLVKQAVEEILRYHTPSALNSRRVAKEDVRLGNQVWQSL
ncbi:Cytochrome p450 [Aspergillus sclerotialis]|uniref:Cytochrome p450 n=1 Tax=Aspergillus sclerotialis TaxID=2070753 RepID=A0A3A2ZXE7_9EURO|nr:Cytochrome p450 [Aspergillus sclerotialis]